MSCEFGSSFCTFAAGMVTSLTLVSITAAAVAAADSATVVTFVTTVGLFTDETVTGETEVMLACFSTSLMTCELRGSKKWKTTAVIFGSRQHAIA